jgi:protease-4
MSDVAASGGYWIASKATRVFANPATYTGSIGVVMGRLSLQDAYEKVGVAHGFVKRGENADILSMSTDLRPEQAATLERNVAEAYADFLEVVASGRDMTEEEVDAVAQGRVWTGVQALEHGLVDDLGGLREALAAARAEAGIGPTSSTAIRVYPEPRTFFEEFSRLFTTVAAARVARQAWAAMLPTPAARALDHFQRLASSGTVWALMDAALPSSR